jgi:signal recognition particle subunit SRP54
LRHPVNLPLDKGLFESLSTRIQGAFTSLRGEVRLTPEHIESALREIRLALLEADVNFQVVKAFIDRVRDKATEQTVLKSLTPVQQVVKIVRDELLALFGDAEGGLRKDAPTPRVVLLLGLQGSGKTTTSGKLGLWLRKQGKHPLMVSTDVRRPAAIQQLAVVGEKAEVKVFAPETMDPVARASGALAQAKALGFDTVIVDTAGRLHIDDELMDELQAIKEAVQPSDLLYVADSMTGQDAIKSAGEFNRRVGVTGVVLTKLDGDARGGAALSVVSVVGVPVAFIGSGETLEDLELFHPDRIVSRMLGMGDVLSLIEKAEAALDEGEAEKLEEKLRKNQFTLDDFRSQLKTIRRMGPLESVLGMIPGMGQIKELAQNKPDEKQLKRVEAIITSMTAAERANDSIINGSRRKRIAAGSGTSVEDVNRLLKQFTEMRRVIKMIGQGGIGAARHMKNLPKMAPGTEGFAPGGTGKKRKKGGPWGLIKSR